MSALVWILVALALWHFTVFLPDHFWGGIVGAFLGALVGSFLFGFVIHGFDVPGQDETDLMAALEAVPGTLIGLGVIYLIGLRQERAEAQAHPSGLT